LEYERFKIEREEEERWARDYNKAQNENTKVRIKDLIKAMDFVLFEYGDYASYFERRRFALTKEVRALSFERTPP